MKTFSIAATLFVGLASLQAQTTSQQTVSVPEATAYRIMENGANHRVWRRETYELSSDGTIVTNIHKYTELASGLNYQDTNGNWVESKELIESYPGGAVARQGQYQVIFANNLNSYGSIDMQTPDRKRLRSNILGLMYYDTSTGDAVLIAEVKDSTGELIADNQVLYPDAFDGVKADVRYTYKRAGFEQDVILREQPPTPQSYGLNPATTELEVFTEFIDPPSASVEDAGASGPGLEDDQNVSWGAISLGRGKAFIIGGQGQVPVIKRYVTIQSRHFLLERVPMQTIEKPLSNLPEQASNEHKLPYLASKDLNLPSPRLAGQPKPMLKMAGGMATEKGYVMDYVTIGSSYTDYTFQGDTTYYISGTVNLSGTTTIEGGTVLKYAETNTATIGLSGYLLVCKTGPYRMAVLTSKNDNSAGQTISGSTGNPTNSNSGVYLSAGSWGNPNNDFRYLRLSFAGTGLAGGKFTNGVWNCQFVQCQTAVSNSTTADVYLRNVLLTGCGTGVASSGNVYGENLTVDQVGSLVNGSVTGGALTNCVLTAVSSLGALSAYNSVQYASGSGVYESVGAGNYYLAAGSTNRDVGTTNINVTLLADFQKKTTYCPILYSNVTVSTNVTFSPQAKRDTDTPDLGYHYDPIDYLIAKYVVSGATLTLTNGVAIGCLNDKAFTITNKAAVNCVGTANHPIWLFTYGVVQEKNVKIGTSSPYAIWAGYNPFATPSGKRVPPTGRLNFTKFSWLAGAGGGQVQNENQMSGFNSITITNCEFYNGANTLSFTDGSSTVLVNNLFVRETFNASANTFSYVQSSFQMVSCTVHGGTVSIDPGTNEWGVFSSCFDSANVSFSASGGGVVANDCNAFFNCPSIPSGGGLLTFANPPVWYSGPLGDFYQPTDIYEEYGCSDPLTNAGGDMRGYEPASLWGLYHFTTQTNQTIEGSSIVDIGYHYVAVDARGNPLDTDGDGISDYLEDANGNGVFDTSDLSDWQLSPYNGLGSANKLQVFTPLK